MSVINIGHIGNMQLLTLFAWIFFSTMACLSVYSSTKSIGKSSIPGVIFWVSFIFISPWRDFLIGVSDWTFILFPFLTIMSTAFIGEKESRLRLHFVVSIVSVFVIITLAVLANMLWQKNPTSGGFVLPGILFVIYVFVGYIYLGIYLFRFNEEMEFDEFKDLIWKIAALFLAFSFCTLLLITRFSFLASHLSFWLFLLYPIAIFLSFLVIWGFKFVLGVTFIALIFVFPLTFLTILAFICMGGSAGLAFVFLE